VVGRDLGRAFLAVEGSALDVNRAFAITLIDWLGPKQLRYHTPEGTPRIAPEIADSVIGIAGLDTSPRIRPMFVPPIADVPVGGMRPADAALAYDIKPLHDAGINGEGQTIAIVSFDTFLDSDVAAFDAFVGITAPPVERRPAPAGYQPVLGDGSGEVNLDIDIIRAIAPAATIIDYEADPNTDFAEVFAAILDDGRANVVSVSWGGCEIDWPPIQRVLTDSVLERAYVQGVNIFSASGDTGAFSCAHQRDANDDRPSGVYPSTSPFVISVGGTFLWVREDGSYLKEAAWEEAFRKIGSGGGPSDTYARPDWQVGSGIAIGTQRLTPDVAGPADGESGMIFASTPVGGSSPDIGPAGGTSAAAPFWSASMLLAQQLAEREGVGPLGQLAPMLYDLAATPAVPPLFHDVTLGGNLSEPATTGWDAATGLGSPDVTALANAIVLRLRAGE
ncbi:MAG: S53 family peptidase, partial [Candidatus Limnocylindrales bacterium]